MRIIRFAYGDEDRAQFVRNRQFALGLLTRADERRAAATAPSSQRRQCLKGCPRVAKVIDEGAESARPYVLAAA